MTLLITLLLLFVLRVTECAGNCANELQEAKISPKYTGNVPDGDLRIVYDASHEVKCGNELPILVTGHVPLVFYDVEGKCENVSIMFFGKSILPLPVFLLWFVNNIPAAVLKEGYYGQAGDEQASYDIPKGTTGTARFTFCVYCQTEYIKPGKQFNILSRRAVKPRCLARQNHLQEPEACSFYYQTAVDTKVLQDVPL